jgi:hypothetical protein
MPFILIDDDGSAASEAPPIESMADPAVDPAVPEANSLAVVQTAPEALQPSSTAQPSSIAVEEGSAQPPLM